MASVFDTTSLTNTQFTEALDTTITPVPEGEFVGVCEKFEFRQIESNKGGVHKTYLALETYWALDSEEVRAATLREKNTVRYTIFLDLTDHGTLDMSKGKNVQLGRLRDALGQNKPGKPWSFGDMIGQVATCMVSHRTNDEGDIFAECKKIAAS